MKQFAFAEIVLHFPDGHRGFLRLAVEEVQVDNEITDSFAGPVLTGSRDMTIKGKMVPLGESGLNYLRAGREIEISAHGRPTREFLNLSTGAIRNQAWGD